MNARLTLFFYNLLFPLAFLGMLPNLAMRMMRRGNYRNKFGQRFGFYGADVRARLAPGGRVWIHSISVGETFLALKLARKMKTLDPSLQMVLSVTTSTGFALADKSASDWLEVIYNPLDTLPVVLHALNVVRPAQLIFIEAMWPNLLLGAKKRGVPVAMIPRLSDRAARRFTKAKFFTGGFFGAFDLLCAQEPEDVAKLKAVGADPAKIQVTGGIKFDHADDKPSTRKTELRDMVRWLGVQETTPVILAGSTFPGEEQILAKTYLELREKFKNLFLILVPRHVERTPQLVEELKPLGLNIALRTELSEETTTTNTGKPDCLIVDTTGELRDWYHIGDITYIGKSLEGYGGQNPVEAAAAGKPVVFGPHMENFKGVIRLLLEHRAAIQVKDPAELKIAFDGLLADPVLRAQMGNQGPDAIASHQGATTRAAKLLLQQHREASPTPEAVNSL